LLCGKSNNHDKNIDGSRQPFQSMPDVA
jgi:hypothetical protein